MIERDGLTSRVCSVDELYGTLAERVKEYLHEPVLICVETTFADDRATLYQTLVLTPTKMIHEATDEKGQGYGKTRYLRNLRRIHWDDLDRGVIRVEFECVGDESITFDFPNKENFDQFMDELKKTGGQ